MFPREVLAELVAVLDAQAEQVAAHEQEPGLAIIEGHGADPERALEALGATPAADAKADQRRALRRRDVHFPVTGLQEGHETVSSL